VPAVEPDIRGAQTIREQLARHRAVASCAACHAQIDPLGFALENYDVIGGWREKYRVTPDPKVRHNFEQITLTINTQPRRLLLGPPVDAADKLADGRRFRDLAELKQLLLADPEPLARTVTEKLLIYATGKGLSAGDDVVVGDIVAAAQSSNYGLRSLVHAVIASPTFQTK
jgi:hypothetical protein